MPMPKTTARQAEVLTFEIAEPATYPELMYDRKIEDGERRAGASLSEYAQLKEAEKVIKDRIAALQPNGIDIITDEDGDKI